MHACAFAVAVCALATVLTAATPIFRLSVQKGCDALAEEGRGSVSRFWQRIGANLVVLELVVAVVLLASAGLLTRSLYGLLHIPLGFDPAHLATMQISAPTAVSTDAQTDGLYLEITDRVGRLPGVRSVGLTSLFPVQCNCAIDMIHVIGRPQLSDHNEVDERHVSPTYLPTIGATLIRGRHFTDADDASKPGFRERLPHRPAEQVPSGRRARGMRRWRTRTRRSGPDTSATRHGSAGEQARAAPSAGG